MNILAAPELPAKLQKISDRPSVRHSVRAALERLRTMPLHALTSGTDVIAAKNGVYVMRAGPVRIFYTVDTENNYVLLLDVVPFSEHFDSFEPEVSDVEMIDWEDLTKRLLAFTEYRLRRYRWRGAIGELPAGTKTAEDYVYDAIEAFLSGRRRLPAGTKTLFTFLCGVIASELSHDALRAENVATTESLDAEGAPEIRTVDDPEQRVINAQLVRRFVDAIEEPSLRAYAELLAERPAESVDEYARILGVSALAVRNMRRRLERLRISWSADEAWRGRPAAAEVRPARELSADDAVAALGADIDAVAAAATTLEMEPSKLDAELRRLGVNAEETVAAVDDLQSARK